MAAREPGAALILALPDHLERFLALWTRNMGRAGYLEHTTAKREDCILSFRWFLDPLLERLAQGRPAPDFAALVQGPADWARPVLETACRHHGRGITAGMFYGCLRTLIHAIEEIIDGMDAPPAERAAALGLLRPYADACATLVVDDWAALSGHETRRLLDATNRELTLGKNRYENILAAISDAVLMVGPQGVVEEANDSAAAMLGAAPVGRALWEVLGLEGRSMVELARYYPADKSHEISLGESRFLDMTIVPLSAVSLASTQTLVVLTDVTARVNQRAALERVVHERTEALSREKAQLEEMNITLRHVLGSIEREREDFGRSVAHTVQTVLLPALGTVRGLDRPGAPDAPGEADVRRGYLDILQDQLQRLATGGGDGADARLLSLTPTEMKICRFLQAGSSSKDIADAMHLSLGTIQTHRKSIRRKLGLQGRGVNLYSFLQQADTSAAS